MLITRPMLLVAGVAALFVSEAALAAEAAAGRVAPHWRPQPQRKRNASRRSSPGMARSARGGRVSGESTVKPFLSRLGSRLAVQLSDRAQPGPAVQPRRRSTARGLVLVARMAPGLLPPRETAHDRSIAAFVRMGRCPYVAAGAADEFQRGIDLLHTRNLVHGSINPENVRIDRFGHMYLGQWHTLRPAKSRAEFSGDRQALAQLFILLQRRWAVPIPALQ